MAAFKVNETYYMGKLDLIVMTGSIVKGTINPGMFVTVPKALSGPGKVPIAGVESVQFTDRQELAITVRMTEFDKAPSLEFSHLHGQVLDVTG